MTIKASAGSALILAAGLLVGFAGSLPAIAAGADADNATVSKSDSATSGKSARHKKRYAHRNYTRAAPKSAESKKANEKQVADASGGSPPAIPDWLANANAQMTAADAAAAPDSAKGMSAAMSEKANTVLQAAVDQPADAEAPANTAAAAPDQLNETDRALHLQEATAGSSQTIALASTSRPAAEAATNDSSTLDKTSLIGKIFIAFGALLTVASAARMFMA
jgi:hypothetical protein